MLLVASYSRMSYFSISISISIVLLFLVLSIIVASGIIFICIIYYMIV